MSDTSYPCFLRYQDEDGRYYWLYFASNGEEVARSQRSYSSAQECDHSVVVMKACAPARYYAEA
jgi:uncharacterized protein YegP (UPF0339 family)